MDAAVRPATRNDLGPLAAALGRAFVDDPVQRWIFPDDRRREAACTRLFEALLRVVHLPHGTTWTTMTVAGGAVWGPPDHWKTGLRAIARLAPSAVPVLGRRLPLVLRGLTAVEDRHPKEPHWYLAILGTVPQCRGRGVGSALLGPVLARCDSEGLPAYLESSKEENIPFYARHGFRVTGEITLPRGPVVYPMWRDPRP